MGVGMGVGMGVAGRRVAAIDCGTNSIRLLIADVSHGDAGPTLTDVHRDMRIVRLGQDVDATGRLAPAALARTRNALADYAAAIGESEVDSVRMTATSATRDAENADEFVAMVRATLGQDPEVIAGHAEAELSFRGAVGELPAEDAPFLVFDIGGGSTEFVIGAPDGHGGVTLTAAVSQNIGSVRITERCLSTDPPTAAEISSARTWAETMVADGLAALPHAALADVRRVVAVAGTATTVCAAALDLASYEPSRIHLATLSPERIGTVTDRLLAQTRAERVALPFMHPGRADVIGGGAVILDTIVGALQRRFAHDAVTISEHDILDGIALSQA